MISLAPAPAVALHIDCAAGAVTQVRLAPYPTFSCQIYAEPGLSPHFQQELIDWLFQYSKKKPGPLPPYFSLDKLSPFQKKVLETMSQIPFGKVTSYGELARLAGNPKASRALGGACHRNPFPLFFPCHRVIQRGGSIGGFAGGIEIKKKLLGFEGNGPQEGAAAPPLDKIYS